MTDGTLRSEAYIGRGQRLTRKIIIGKADAYLASGTRAKEKLLHHVEEFCNDRPAMLALMNGDAAEEAAAMKPLLKKAIKQGKIVAEDQITATLAINPGPGLVGIGILVDP